MDFKVSTKTTDGITVMDITGRITAGDALTTFRQAVRDEVANGHDKILLNLKNVSYVDSSGLGAMMSATVGFWMTSRPPDAVVLGSLKGVGIPSSVLPAPVVG